MKNVNQTTPLFNVNEVRAHFILRGTNYTNWALKHGFGPYAVCKIIRGSQHGKKRLGQRIVKALNKELGRVA